MNKNQFEIPEQFRQMAEKNVEMASNAYSQMMDSMVNAMGMWTSSMPDNPAMAGFKPLQDKAIEFANKNSEAGLKLAKDIGGMFFDRTQCNNQLIGNLTIASTLRDKL